jgi:hypothetical protein
MDNRGRAHEFVNFGIALPTKLRDIGLGLHDRASRSIRDRAAHVPDGLQAGHLVFNSGLAGEEVGLLRAQSLGVYGKCLRKRVEVRCQLSMHLCLEPEKFGIGRPGRSDR